MRTGSFYLRVTRLQLMAPLVHAAYRVWRSSFEIDLTGDIVNMIEFAESGLQTKKAASSEAAVPDAYRSSVKVVAGVGFEPTTFRL